MKKRELKEIVELLKKAEHNSIEVTEDEDEPMTVDEMQDYLIDYGIATQAEINLVCNINGYNEETMRNILCARTGYRSFEQFKEEL